MARKHPGFDCPDSGVFEDQIVVLDRSGVELKRVSLFEAFYRSEYAPFLPASVSEQEAHDIFRANSVHIVENRQAHSLFATGEVIVSLRELTVRTAEQK